MVRATYGPPLIVLCAFALGLIAWAADHVSSDSALPMAAGMGNLPSHWLVTAFVMGVVARERAPGAAFAALGLALAVAVYYAAISLAGDRPGADLAGAARAWLVLALAAGPVFGIAGATWLSGPALHRPWAVALLCGALAGEALYLAEFHAPSRLSLDDTATVFALAELSVAAALPFVLLSGVRERAVALAGGLVCAVAMAVVMSVVIDVVRDVISPL
jgi:hypothetical protein